MPAPRNNCSGRIHFICHTFSLLLAIFAASSAHVTNAANINQPAVRPKRPPLRPLPKLDPIPKQVGELDLVETRLYLSYYDGDPLSDKSRTLLNWEKCITTPKTHNQKIIGNQNWTLFKCGRISLVQHEIYTACDPGALVGKRFSSDFTARMNWLTGEVACLINPVSARYYLRLRDTKGAELPLSLIKENEDENALRGRKMMQSMPDLRLGKKWDETRYGSEFYLVEGIRPTGSKSHYVGIGSVYFYRSRPFSTRVPSL
jgi:hypothetical protein